MVAQQFHESDAAYSAAEAHGDTRSRRAERIATQLRGTGLAPPDRRELANQLVEAHICAAKSIAARYRNRGVELEDLEQVAMFALTKAARRFDPDAGHDFMSYAAPTIRGEIRRHFRDSGWMVRPPRRVQELQAHLRHAQRELEMQLGRSPRPSELAAHLEKDLGDVVEALSADGCFAPTSLDSPVGGGSIVLGDLLASESRDLDAAEARVILSPVVRRLPKRDRHILEMRYVEQRSQQEIADTVGLTQAQVSRVLARILRQLRDELTTRPQPWTGSDVQPRACVSIDAMMWALAEPDPAEETGCVGRARGTSRSWKPSPNLLKR